MGGSITWSRRSSESACVDPVLLLMREFEFVVEFEGAFELALRAMALTLGQLGGLLTLPPQEE